MNYFIYDLETLINCFTFSGKFRGRPEIYTFEISSRKNQKQEILTFLSYLQNLQNTYMVGFNSLGFDYPILHCLLNEHHTFSYTTAYNLCQQIIGSQNYGGGFNQIKMSDRIIPQIDLVKVNHFDNANRRTPLKSLQVAMRLPSVEDMPVEMGVNLTDAQMDEVILYNHNDVRATEEFLERCIKQIEMRKELLDNGVLTGDVLNFSDVKIGAEYLVKRIGRSKCFNGYEPRQTTRKSVEFADIILPKIFYRTEPFQEVLEWFKKQVIYPGSKIDPPKLQARLANLDFHFGVGGVHASVVSKSFASSESHQIIDVDVTGMYPSIAIANGFAPEHLGEDFKVAYKQLVSDRARYPKGSMMNGVLKLASNGTFGNTDNPYSCFYDPRYPKQVTINGQLQILQLVEYFSLIPGVDIIQANTDGVTIYLPRKIRYLFDLWKADWESITGLRLEEVEYSKMWIRDVNNYLCLISNGKIKAKGAYWCPKDAADYDGVWNKDFSNMVVQKVIEQSLTKGWNPDALVLLMTDPFDFMIRYKTPKGAKLFIGDKEMTKTVRYYVSTKGEPMKKIATPTGEIGAYKRKSKLTDEFFEGVMNEIGPGVWDARIHTGNKSKYEMTETSIENGRLVKCCNRASDFNWEDVDYDYYIKEIEKLEI